MDVSMEKKTKKRKVQCACQKKLDAGKCTGTLVLTHEDGYPIFICDSCGDRHEEWKKFYSEYMCYFRDQDKWLEPKNKVSCIIGLFCYLYKEKYKTSYVFVPKCVNPFSAKECRDANVMLSSFDGDAVNVRKYLVWAFSKGISNGANITSMAYLNAPNLIRKFKLMLEKSHTFNRSTLLPEPFINWCKENVSGVFEQCSLESMNDLGALLNYVKQYDKELLDNSLEKITIKKAEEFGLIKNNKLNVG